jgi:hypothetical protein
MKRRVIIGPRANGDVGIFASPPGVDADTAPDSQLIMNVTSKVSQLILMGHVAAGNNLVLLGLNLRPFVFITSQWDFNGVIGHTAGPGPVRPSPPVGNSSASCAINGNGASMTISSSLQINYFVYSSTF